MDNMTIYNAFQSANEIRSNALHYVNKLFYNGPTSSIHSYSIYAGVEIHESDLSNFQEALEVFFEEEHKVIWLNKPEIAIIK